MPRVRNPFSADFKLASDGLTYTANPDYLAFEGLKNDRQRADFLARRQLGLAPAVELPGLSAIYPNRKSHVNDPMRYARLKSDNGRLLVDLAHRGVLDESLSIVERQGWWDRYWRATRYPNAGAVNEKGETDGQVLGETLWEILQAARQRQALPGASVDGEAREVAPQGGERVGDDTGPDAR